MIHYGGQPYCSAFFVAEFGSKNLELFQHFTPNSLADMKVFYAIYIEVGSGPGKKINEDKSKQKMGAFLPLCLMCASLLLILLKHL
jgi:hypothetical protein